MCGDVSSRHVNVWLDCASTVMKQKRRRKNKNAVENTFRRDLRDGLAVPAIKIGHVGRQSYGDAITIGRELYKLTDWLIGSYVGWLVLWLVGFLI